MKSEDVLGEAKTWSSELNDGVDEGVEAVRAARGSSDVTDGWVRDGSMSSGRGGERKAGIGCEIPLSTREAGTAGTAGATVAAALLVAPPGRWIGRTTAGTKVSEGGCAAGSDGFL